MLCHMDEGNCRQCPWVKDWTFRLRNRSYLSERAEQVRSLFHRPQMIGAELKPKVAVVDLRQIDNSIAIRNAKTKHEERTTLVERLDRTTVRFYLSFSRNLQRVENASGFRED